MQSVQGISTFFHPNLLLSNISWIHVSSLFDSTVTQIHRCQVAAIEESNQKRTENLYSKGIFKEEQHLKSGVQVSCPVS